MRLFPVASAHLSRAIHDEECLCGLPDDLLEVCKVIHLLLASMLVHGKDIQPDTDILSYRSEQQVMYLSCYASKVLFKYSYSHSLRP